MRRSWLQWILATLGLFLLITLLNGEIRLMPTSVSFSLKTRNGEWVSNSEVEPLEQQALLKHWDASWKTGINLGVYIGTSCIFLDSLLEMNDAKASTACIDTNVNIQPILQENLRLNQRLRVHNLNGLLAEVSHCPAEMTVVEHVEPHRIGNETGTPGKPGMLASFEGMGDRGGLPDSFVIERCYTVSFLRELFAGQMPQVWFIDIDGFLPSLYQQIKDVFDDPSVELVLYERDRPYSAGKASAEEQKSDHFWEAQYRDMEEGLKRQGFHALQCDNILWGIWVWRRGGPSFTIHLWLIFAWTACLLSMCLLSDLVVPQKVKKWPVPVWRLLVLLCWRLLYEALPSLPVNMTDPVTGLDCTWTCVHRGVAFAISNFLFLYVAILWPLSKALAVRGCPHPYWLPWLIFTALAESQLICGLLLHALLRAPAAPPAASLCTGPGPQQSMWEVSVGTTLALSLGLLLFVETQAERPPPV